MCRAVMMGTGWHWPWVMLTAGERMVAVSVLRDTMAERNCDLLERTEDDVESGFMRDPNDADDDGKWDAELDGDGSVECTGLGEDWVSARFPVDCLREETVNVSSSISLISLGQSL